jgi:hypothetical protein
MIGSAPTATSSAHQEEHQLEHEDRDDRLLQKLVARHRDLLNGEPVTSSRVSCLSPPPAFHIPTPSRADASWNRRAATMSPIILREFSAVRNEVRGIRATQLRWSGSLACQTKLGRRGDL